MIILVKSGRRESELPLPFSGDSDKAEGTAILGSAGSCKR